MEGALPHNPGAVPRAEGFSTRMDRPLKPASCIIPDHFSFVFCFDVSPFSFPHFLLSMHQCVPFPVFCVSYCHLSPVLPFFSLRSLFAIFFFSCLYPPKVLSGCFVFGCVLRLYPSLMRKHRCRPVPKITDSAASSAGVVGQRVVVKVSRCSYGLAARGSPSINQPIGILTRVNAPLLGLSCDLITSSCLADGGSRPGEALSRRMRLQPELRGGAGGQPQGRHREERFAGERKL